MVRKLFFLTIIAIIIIGVLYYYDIWDTRQKLDEIKKTSEEKVDELKAHRVNVIREARMMLDIELKTGYDLENRPCLSEELVPGWAVDIVHQPTTEVDSMLKNQCRLYQEGKVPNIIYMDEFGHIIDEGIKMGF